MPEDYPINAARFALALCEQRSLGLKGGLYHLTQILMAYNTNRIEGSQLSADQTRYIYETRTVSGDAVNVDDLVEMVNSFDLFDMMIDKLSLPLTADLLKQYHRVLKTGTAHSRMQWFAVGDWKRVPNAVGDTATTPPELVDAAVTELLARYPEASQMSFEDIVDFHHAFELIHPFQDANGRIGRLVMFSQCLQAGIMPFVVLDSHKAFYYRGLARYQAEPGFLRDTLRSFQDDYYGRFAQYVPLVPSASHAV